MAYSEALWVVTGTAAPVIALAAVVSSGEAFGRWLQIDDAIEALVGGVDPAATLAAALTGRPLFAYDVANFGRLRVRFWNFAAPAMRAGVVSVVLLLINVAFQSALLALSPVSIDNHANAVPPWVAVWIAVMGLVILAVVAGLLLAVRTRLLKLRRQFRDDRASDQARAAVDREPGDPSAQPSQG